MKKILSLLIILAVACSFVLAEPQGIHEPGTGVANPEIKEAGQGTGQGLQDDAGMPEGAGEDAQDDAPTPTLYQQGQPEGTPEPQLIMAQEGATQQNRERVQTGLTNALTKVQNEQARQMLERNLNKWMEKYQARMENMEGVEVEEVDEETGEATIKAKEPVKFLGFIKGKATKKFEMDKNGNINEKAPWYRFLYAETE